MSNNQIGLVSFIFVGMTLINRVMEGVMIAGADVTILNQITIFRSFNVLGLFSVPVINISYFTVGLPHLVKWDYSFFMGNGGVIQYFLYSITAMVSFGLFVLLIGTLANKFRAS